ncbi:5-methylcytosine restriction system specificity protein McrC [Myxococcus sp. MISCRS1]|uniref:5-methylcytosine restriction system specificity protein McrC n=1 Tax=Myxococcus sp. MISCRS1 TaxID=2996786 RepID=UPI002D1E3E51|nr:hypothetical protein [Myxococcus sp. MISCRS1]
MDIRTEVRAQRGVHLVLHPGGRIGAVPLLSPSTRKVVAGLLVEPRFRWTSLGSVFERIGFSVEPTLGDSLLVPGSARQVPPWLLAAPVLRRLEALWRHQRRGFAEVEEERPSPRGRIDWRTWATRNVPVGRWERFPCAFPEPVFDPQLLGELRWTVSRLTEELGRVAETPVGRTLLERTRSLALQLGPGPQQRPRSHHRASESTFVAEALQAMGWVADKRGLGGTGSLDGLSWNLAIDEVWEAWVATFTADLATRLGLQPTPHGGVKYRLNWAGGLQSMGALIPDVALRGADRVVWVDAKYKAHLSLLAQQGWRRLTEDVRNAHRADLHQALAYANLAAVDHVDTVLAYPDFSTSEEHPLFAVATMASGKRRVRLILAGIPFGFRSPAHREKTLSAWRTALTS